jgi:hypothetical protein
MTPVHYVFGEHDALTTASMATELPAAIAAPAGTAVRPAGHRAINRGSRVNGLGRIFSLPISAGAGTIDVSPLDTER